MKRAAAKKKGYTAKDMHAVSDNAEWTGADFARSKPFKKVFPDLRKSREPKAPSKKL